MPKLRIIIGGYIGLYPTGGAALDYIQYPLALKELGHDVYYIEDTMQFPVYQENRKSWSDASDCVNYLQKTMEDFGFKDRWAYRDIASGECFGMPLSKVLELCQSADIFINLSCSTVNRDEYYKIPKRILIDTDPMFTQIQVELEKQGLMKSSTNEQLATHNYLFSFGENIGQPDCRIPLVGYKWRTTRQPICLDLWKSPALPVKYSFTSVMNWKGRKKLEYKNEKWGQKDGELKKLMKLPRQLPNIALELVINFPKTKEGAADHDRIIKNGWKILDPKQVVVTHKQYINFIQSSLAEFSIAKETYVKARTGWFSCRSACYLAAGKPVIAQDTGWTKYLPSGEGLLAFTDIESAVEGIIKVNKDIKKHSKACHVIAHEYFDGKKILEQMINSL